MWGIHVILVLYVFSLANWLCVSVYYEVECTHTIPSSSGCIHTYGSRDPWNPWIWWFWTSKTPPVSTYSRLHINICTYSGPYSGTLWSIYCYTMVYGMPYGIPYTLGEPFGHLHMDIHDIHTSIPPSGVVSRMSQIPPKPRNMAILDISQNPWIWPFWTILDIWNSTRE